MNISCTFHLLIVACLHIFSLQVWNRALTPRGVMVSDDFNIVYHTSVDRHVALPHSFYPTSATEFHLPRSAIDPPERLVAMIFPFIDDISQSLPRKVIGQQKRPQWGR